MRERRSAREGWRWRKTIYIYKHGHFCGWGGERVKSARYAAERYVDENN
jgi:hypothetical protein